MSSYHYKIASKSKTRPTSVAALGDFELTDQEAFDPARLVGAPQWTLYSIDPATDQAIFVELPKGTDLGNAPFVYGMQFELAQSVAVVPLEQFIALGLQIPTGKLAMLYSTGRCGSTLASRILAQLPGVWSLSEPDCLTNLVFARHTTPAKLMDELLSAARRFLCGLAPEATVVIKPRSEQAFQAEAFAKANPDARNVFMYRDAVGYVNSMFRMVQRSTGNPAFLTDPEARQLGWFFASADAPVEEATTFFPDGEAAPDNLEAIVLGWLLRIRAIKEASEHGVPVVPLHYADLTADRRGQTEKLLSACGIDRSLAEHGLAGFGKDAHEGSATANSVPTIDINEAQKARIASLLARWRQSPFLDERLSLAF